MFVGNKPSLGSPLQQTDLIEVVARKDSGAAPKSGRHAEPSAFSNPPLGNRGGVGTDTTPGTSVSPTPPTDVPHPAKEPVVISADAFVDELRDIRDNYIEADKSDPRGRSLAALQYIRDSVDNRLAVEVNAAEHKIYVRLGDAELARLPDFPADSAELWAMNLAVISSAYATSTGMKPDDMIDVVRTGLVSGLDPHTRYEPNGVSLVPSNET